MELLVGSVTIRTLSGTASVTIGVLYRSGCLEVRSVNFILGGRAGGLPLTSKIVRVDNLALFGAARAGLPVVGLLRSRLLPLLLESS